MSASWPGACSKVRPNACRTATGTTNVVAAALSASPGDISARFEGVHAGYASPGTTRSRGQPFDPEHGVVAGRLPGVIHPAPSFITRHGYSYQAVCGRRAALAVVLLGAAQASQPAPPLIKARAIYTVVDKTAQR